MPNGTTSSRARKGAGARTPARSEPQQATPDFTLPDLPPIDVAKFEEVGKLLERTVDENTDLFISKGNEFRARHRAATRRPLAPDEAAQIAAAVVGDTRPPEELAEAFQNREGFEAYDEPDPRQVLIASGIATAPAAVKATRRLVALIEMSKDDFWAALDVDRLDAAIDQAADELRKLDVTEARARAAAALEHLTTAVGDESGKGPWLMAKTVWQALSQAMSHLIQDDGSGLSSLLRSALPASATDETYSSSPTETPAS